MKARLDRLASFRLAATVAAFSLAGCSILEPRADPSRFYVLTATPGPARDGDLPPANLTVGLGPIELPDYLDRSQLVTRVGANRVELSEFERWAEPLERNFSRILIENLIQRLNTEKIVPLPSFIAIPVQYEVPIEVQRFESDGQGTVELVARWRIRDSAGDVLLHADEARITESAGSGTEEAVAALSRSVARLSDEIARDLLRLSAPK